MDAYLVSVLSACACALVLLLPLALRGRSEGSAIRDAAWRDRLPAMLRLLRPALRWYAATVDDSLTGHERDAIQVRLNTAGSAYLITPAEFLVIRRFAFVAGIAVACYVIFVLQITDPMYLALTASLPPFAWLYPDIWLRDRASKRRAGFEKQFPFFLDVLVLGMKAGLTFAASVEQAVDHLQEGPVRQEFSRYLRETRAGSARRIALERLAVRVAIPAVTNFVACVSQAEETGGSLADVLSDQARQRRQERFLRAEKLANQAPVKMLFPLIALLFPVTFIIIGFPIVIQLVESGVVGLLK
jgi:tight adherence protein C